MPSAENPKYGNNIMGRYSEAGINAGIQFGITRNSEHPEIARDFLLFMAGKEMQELWTRESGWIPAVVGVPPSPEALPFMPKTEGYVGGFSLSNAGGADLNRIIDNNFYLLISPFGDGSDFRKAIAPSFRKSLLSDLRRDNQRQLMSSRRTDGILGGLAWMAKKNPADENSARKYDLLIQAGNARDRAFYLTRAMLLRAGETTE
jgi:raffinose/stachyose/melibiose transport system substrate-binding protein